MRERQTLLWKLLRNFLILSLVQVAIILLIANALGLFDSGYKNSYHSFNYNIEVRAEMLEKMFRGVTRDLTHAVTEDNAEFNRYLAQNGMTAADLVNNREVTDALLVDKTQDLIDYLLTHDDVLGAFLVFGTEELGDGESTLPGVYISKDTVNVESDFTWDSWYLIAGSPQIAETYNIRYYHLWDRDFRVSAMEGNKSFFNVPFAQAAQDGANHYYISELFRFQEGTETIITVTIPLVDDNGQPYGVGGASFYMGTTLSNLSSISLSNVSRGFYSLSSEGSDFSRAFVTSNSLGDSYLAADLQQAELLDEEYNIYRYRDSDGELENMLASYKELQLYDADSPYRGRGYWLFGFVSEAELLLDMNNFIILSGLFFASFILFSVIAIVFVSVQISKPVIRLASDVQSIDSDSGVKLRPTGISEIDLLLGALENFSHKLVQSASRFSSIIDLLEKPIGGFEENYTEDRVYITDSISKIFNAPYKGKYYISHAQWQELKATLSGMGDEEYADTYRCVTGDRPERYLQLTTKQAEGKVLGIVMDVTEEILEKKRLKSERDTDSLTHLSNRRGFRAAVCRLMENLRPGMVGAMIFMDLDNLKAINDTYGHKMGDEYIKTMAGAMGVFERGGAVTCRLSGDEFAVFLHGFDSKEAVRALYQSAFDHIWDTCIRLPDGSPRYLTFSAGVAWWPDDAADYTTLMRYADFAMYKVKHSTKNSFAEFDPQLYAGKTGADPVPQV